MHRIVWLVCAALCWACESTEPGDEDDGARGNVILLDENNYSSQSALSIPTIETASATDLDICWGDVDQDIQCHDVNAQEDLDAVALLRFLHLDEEEVEVKLTAGQLDMSEVDGYLDYETADDPGATCAKLSSLTLLGTEVDVEEEYVASDDRTYLLLLTEGTTPGVGARSMIFLHPSESSTNTMVEAQPGCGFLEFSADLTSAEPVSIPADGPWVIDWRDVTEDSLGNEIVFENIDGVLVGFFEGLTVAELEAQILDLELIATQLWEVELDAGKTADLADARDRDGGDAFPGFERDEEGVWMLGLMCSTCQNPSPVVLAVLEPGDE
jgi:hypothetical protein